MAQTSLKMDSSDHQALVAILKYQAAQITARQLEPILFAQGRNIQGLTIEQTVARMSEMLVKIVQ